jgi:hypothetical protein
LQQKLRQSRKTKIAVFSAQNQQGEKPAMSSVILEILKKEKARIDAALALFADAEPAKRKYTHKRKYTKRKHTAVENGVAEVAHAASVSKKLHWTQTPAGKRKLSRLSLRSWHSGERKTRTIGLSATE